ncbi:hypothetical protein OG410_41690 [Streptomyces sp. NBC_00659]|uniref:hypothetical protein n=1 Tax=Streptomyces sp. NBC_00659 TaxID=2903669 RepID=UPI002E2EAAD3|nr:hypothetical protein [Streptomyces sp. NBC_00659]
MLSPSLKHAATALHIPLLLLVGGFAWLTPGWLITLGRTEYAHPAAVVLVAAGTAAICGPRVAAYVGYVSASFLAGLDWWPAFLPAELVVAYRVADTVVVLVAMRRKGGAHTAARVLADAASHGGVALLVKRAWAHLHLLRLRSGAADVISLKVPGERIRSPGTSA